MWRMRLSKNTTIRGRFAKAVSCISGASLMEDYMACFNMAHQSTDGKYRRSLMELGGTSLSN